jgi:uroporphyrinogen decarboxylase
MIHAFCRRLLTAHPNPVTFLRPTMLAKTCAVAAALLGGASAFSPAPVAAGAPAARRLAPASRLHAGAAAVPSAEELPLLLRMAKGEEVEHTPVWMMRQAGRHMAVYRELCKEHPTFRERTEKPEVAFEISMQPYRSYGTDGVILFSDILTPLPGMGCEYQIDEKKGPVMTGGPIRDERGIDALTMIDGAKDCSYVGETLGMLRKEVGNKATVMGFVGSPYTLATYIVEGGSSKEYLEIKKMGFKNPKLLHKLLKKLADGIAEYACYQIESGAQVIQLFDSWAGHLSYQDYDEFAAP